jgi:hypothetical protein
MLRLCGLAGIIRLIATLVNSAAVESNQPNAAIDANLEQKRMAGGVRKRISRHFVILAREVPR